MWLFWSPTNHQYVFIENLICFQSESLKSILDLAILTVT